MTRSEAWVKFVVAKLSIKGNGYAYSARVADEMLAEFDKRFPDSKN